jgi:anaerobic selenocysteine-containing dehydrogenase
MKEWRTTFCAMCAMGCGLEVLVEDNRMVQVRADKRNLRSEGYVCRKGTSVVHHQHNADRLLHPLKRVGSGFQRISWEQAISEIAEKMQATLDGYGPRSLAFMGGGGVGCHFEAGFMVSLMRALGSQYYYNPLGQEFSGYFWAMGEASGSQCVLFDADIHHADMLVTAGWNGMQSHQIPQAPRVLKEFSRNPDKLLVVIDPRKSETAKLADIHLALRPGTDALLTRAMIAIIVQEGWHDRDYIERHVSGFDQIEPWFSDFDAKAALEVCELDYDQVREVCHQFATRTSCMRPDLGVFMNRHSTATSYLHVILWAICGRIGVPGGHVIPGTIAAFGRHTDWDDPDVWHTLATDFAPTNGVFPPAVLPEEILSGHPQRIRSLYVSQANPLRSYPDTSAYEEAFERLDLLVTTEVAMTETAALSHYVLPATSAFEKWDSTFFPLTFPEVFFNMRRPIVEPEGERLEDGEILVRLADRLGLIPEIPESLYVAAKGERPRFFAELMKYALATPDVLERMPFVLGKTLGPVLGSTHLAALWGMLQVLPEQAQENAVRAGFQAGPGLGEEIFQGVLEHPQGLWIGRADVERNLELLQTPDGKVNVYIPRMAERVQSIDAASEARALEPDPPYPLVLNAGRHFDKNANTLLRNPAWNKRGRVCTLLMNPADAEALQLSDAQMVRVITEAGEELIELEVTDATRRGLVIMPHGFGLVYDGEVFGANANRLAKNTNRDEFAATPLHKYVRCSVEAAS